jgi:5-formyltetrahydrofolate cyclo-ligase family
MASPPQQLLWAFGDSLQLRALCVWHLGSSNPECSKVVGVWVLCTVALAFKEQLLEEVPTHEHDRTVDVVVTAEKVWRCTAPGQAF